MDESPLPATQAVVPPGPATRRPAEAARRPWRAPALIEVSIASLTRNNPDVGGDGLGFGSTLS
ncbi:MAG: hypothetical protein H2042_10635 [Rhizobiales bacterium]|nr:hypothetical protein [Hyphomicrobiales bacterium]